MRRIILLAVASCVVANDGLAGWLRYSQLPEDSLRSYVASLPTEIIKLPSSAKGPVSVAVDELQKGLEGIFGKDIPVATNNCSGNSTSLVVGTLAEYQKICGNAREVPNLIEDGFWLSNKGRSVEILAQNERGALYGAFKYLSMLAQGNFSQVAFASNPDAPIRWANQWDNMDYTTSTHGSVERGYGGYSIFFKDGAIVDDLTRAGLYARLLASIGINGIVVNNVNANPTLLNPKNIEGLARIADVMRPYGVRLGISINFASPRDLGNLTTFDPLDNSVIEWWGNKTNELYARIPDMLGYLVKANSEGQPGPLTYNRTLADGANMFAKAVKLHGGIIMFRAFVYNHLADFTNWHNDRANAAVEFFKHLDGKFDDNVVVQIKYGPIDFQVREPPSPLFANLFNTSTAIELQVTQEYLGHQNHLVYLPPMWKGILDFDMRVDAKPSLVRNIVSGKRFNRKLGGYAGVVNVGMDQTWLGSHLAMSNLYAYGKLAWDPTSNSEDIIRDWARLTFGLDVDVIDTIARMSMISWPAYENYTGNLGIQTLTDILYTHYGPNPAAQDNNGWGQWTRATSTTIGMDRTTKNGTKNTSQYPPEVAAVFENIETTPDNLLLWFHHVPYTYRLHSGKTVIQHFYDAHYAGAETAQTFPVLWERLKGKIDNERYEHVLFRLNYQAGHSIVWRDSINYFYYNLSHIPDEAGRVGNHTWRVEAEDMTLDGYKFIWNYPPETASAWTAIMTASNITAGTATWKVDFPTGKYNLAINYYDMIHGQATWAVHLGSRLLGSWKGDNDLRLGNSKSEFPDGHSACRITFPGIDINKGDILKIIGTPNGIEAAPLDYISFFPEGIID
jgi:alpha-glucuronidase